MTEFLFIDYQDDNPENRSVKKTKTGFARRSSHRQQRLLARERLKPSSLVFRQPLPLPYIASESDTFETGRADKSQEGGLNLDAALAGTERHQPVVIPGSPKTLFGDSFVDPFSTTAFPMTEFMNSFFHQLRHFTIPGAYPLDKSCMAVWWWQQGLCQPVIQLALLGSAAGHQTAMYALQNISNRYSQQSMKEYLRIQGNTLRVLNGLLQSPAAAKSTVLIVGSLRAIEAIEGNVEITNAHTKGLDILIRLHGGLEMLDHMVLSKVYHGDIMRAALTNTTPALPLIASWRNDILQEVNVFHSTRPFTTHLDDRFKDSASRISLLGTSFFAAPWYQGLEDSMKKFLFMCQRAIQYYEVACLRPSIVMRTDNDLFVLLEHQLLSIRYTPDPSASYPVSSLSNEPLRITLFVYLNMRVWNFQVFPIMQSMVKLLRQSLLSTVPIPTLTHIRHVAPDVLFWMLFIGSMASRGHDEHSWFVAQLVELASLLEIHDWDTARPILGGFFYTDQTGQPGGEELWEQVIQPAQLNLLGPGDAESALSLP